MNKTFYAPLIKSVESEDGDYITVGGIASSNIVDSDGDTITTEAMEKAKDGYMQFAAIREMHQSIAAGTCTKFEILPNGDTYIEARIYDKETIRKIKAGVLRAFSIGGKVIKRLGKIILEMILIEISVVDRPANSNAIMHFYKADMTLIKQEENNMLDTENEVPATEVPAVIEQSIGSPVVPVEINKSLDTVARLALLIQELTWIQQDMDWEKNCEGDNSTIPDTLKGLVNSLYGVLNASTAEESSEASASMEAEKSSTADLLKAGARNSKSDIEKIQQIYDLALSLGAKSPSAIVQLADTSSDLEKSFKETIETKDELIKSISAEKELLNTEKETLVKRVKELESMPVQKPTSSIVATMSKDEEGGQVTKTIKPVMNDYGKVDEMATLMKAAIFGNK